MAVASTWPGTVEQGDPSRRQAGPIPQPARSDPNAPSTGSDPATQQDPIPQKQQDPIPEAAWVRVRGRSGLVDERGRVRVRVRMRAMVRVRMRARASLYEIERCC